MANQEPKVRVEHLTKRFGDLLVLNDMSFDIKRGERAISWSTASRSTRKNRISRISSRNIPPFRG